MPAHIQLTGAAIIGPRGAGKSTISAALAKRLRRTLISTDGLITERCRPRVAKPDEPVIPQLVDEHGWEGFRAIESAVLANLSRDGILDCGGGIVETETNIALLHKYGPIILLIAPARVLVRRTKGDDNRPKLTDAPDPYTEMVQVLRARRPKYLNFADLIIPTSNRGVDIPVGDVVKQIIDYLKRPAIETRHYRRKVRVEK